MTFKLKYLSLWMLCFILKQDLKAQIVPPPATQAEVDAGVNRFKYVTPYTFANSSLIGGGGGGSSSNFFNINVTNTVQRTVWRAGSTTNLTIPWGVTNRVVWHPASNAGLQMSGTAGGGTNEQIIHVTICLTNSGITSVVMPTNELSGLSPFFLTAPSTNEFDLIYNGDQFYIVSYQTPTTGSGQTVVVNTNPVVWNPTIGVNGASNTFNITSPSVGQALSVHSSSAGVTIWTNGPSSGATILGEWTANNIVSNTVGSAMVTNKLNTLGGVVPSDGTDRQAKVIPYGGYIRGALLNGDAAPTAGYLNIEVFTNGVATGVYASLTSTKHTNGTGNVYFPANTYIEVRSYGSTNLTPTGTIDILGSVVLQILP